jgi:hypothetical protein
MLNGPGARRHVPHPPTTGPAAVETACWGWLRANLGWFHPAAAGRLPRFADFPEGPAIELLMLCRRGHAAAAECLPFLHAALTTPGSEERMYRQPGLFRYHALRYALLNATGCRVPSPIARLAALGFGADLTHERTPQTLLELRYALDLAGVAHPFGPLDAQVRGTLLGRPLDWAQLTDQELYALTHAVLYATDFGSRPAPSWLDSRTIELLLACVLRSGNLDLTGEFLLCLSATERAPRRARSAAAGVVRRAWGQLAARQLDSGAVPGPAFDPARASGGDAYLFATSYHTTITTALAAGGRPC